MICCYHCEAILVPNYVHMVIQNIEPPPLIVEFGGKHTHSCMLGLLGGLVKSCLLARFPTKISVKSILSDPKRSGRSSVESPGL